MIYIRENIPSKLLAKHNFSDDIESLFVELNFRKVKWLLFGTYHPPSQNDIYYFNQLDKAIDTYNNYDKILLKETSVQKQLNPVLNPSYMNMIFRIL